MCAFIAGRIAQAPEITVVFVLYVNSDERFARGTFAPPRAVWLGNNRTADFCLVGKGPTAVRVECRIGGSDVDLYLAQAAPIAVWLWDIGDEVLYHGFRAAEWAQEKFDRNVTDREFAFGFERA